MSENLQRLQALVQHKDAVEWFRGLFRVAHMQITDTGERFTILHEGDRASISEGFSKQEPNFIIPLQSENIQRLAAAFSDHAVSPFEEYRIVKFMLRPCLEASLRMPILKNKALQQIAKVDTHWQEAVLDPDGKEDEQVTVIFVNKQWLVIPGYHGVPQRRVVLKPRQLLEFQRRILEADDKGAHANWLELARWYVRWRDEITVPV
jgi:hypothetical protein